MDIESRSGQFCSTNIRTGSATMFGAAQWEAPDHSQVSSLKIGVETSQMVLPPVWCSKLQANDRRHLALCHDEFRGLCRSGVISNNNSDHCGFP
ncbi:hypothetical protein TNCV_1695361 [Trichonephila clavipes]|nr:hypothetical protein TNCV_1695361 [Trichonephila clavipes]